eukprot:6611105-Alexandrium_andersonii.AAC.1
MATSSFSSRSWEGWATPSAEPGPGTRPSWADCDGEEQLDFGNVPADIAGEELYALLVELKVTNVLSARQTCVLAFWASRSGASGP